MNLPPERRKNGGISMKDPATLAYVNLFAVLGTIPYLCDLDKEAAELIRGRTVMTENS